MAIKGKKKAQARGSQARRRPAQMPRAAVVPRRVVPWYRTNAFRATLIVTAVVIAGIVSSVIASNRADERARAARAEEIDAFAADVRGLLQDVAESGRGLDSAPAPGAELDDEGLTQLRADGRGWSQDFQQALNEASGVLPPAGLESAADLLVQSLGLYKSAADLYGDAARVPSEDLRADLLTRAAQVRDRAAAVWAAAIGLIDSELAEVDEPPTGIAAPTQGAGAVPPAGSLLPPEQDQGGGQGDQEQGRSGGQDRNRRGAKDGSEGGSGG